jgi:hypothetical protein
MKQAGSFATMKFRTTLILTLVLILGILGVVYLDKQDKAKEETTQKNEIVLPYAGEEIVQLGIWPAGIEAVRDSSGWQLLRPVRTAGDKINLNAIASMFEWAKMERTVSEDPGEYPAFGLLPPRAVLVLHSTSRTDTLYVGDESPVGSQIFARKAGHPEVFLTTTSLWSNINKTLFDLRDKNVLDFEQGKIAHLEIKNANGLFTLSKEGNQWQIMSPAAYQGDNNKISELLNSLQYQKAAQFIEENPRDLKPFGLDRPALQIRLGSSADSWVKTLAIGRMEDGTFYARDESRPPVFTVDSSFVRGLQVGLAALRNKKMVRFEPAAADGFEITVGDTTFICQKDTSGTWMVTQPFVSTARAWKITGLLNEVEKCEATGFITDAPASLKPFGLDKPRIHCRVTQQGTLTAELLIGKEKDLADLYAMTGSSKTVYLTKATLYEKLKVRSSDLVDNIPPAAGGLQH